MNKNFTPLVDEHLQSLEGMQEASPGDFFYTRLKARMQKEEAGPGWVFPLKPVWVIGTLFLLLAMNGYMLSQHSGSTETHSPSASSSLQNFAASYDQSVSGY